MADQTPGRVQFLELIHSRIRHKGGPPADGPTLRSTRSGAPGCNRRHCLPVHAPAPQARQDRTACAPVIPAADSSGVSPGRNRDHLGAARRSARTEPSRPDRRSSPWRFAELGSARFFAGCEAAIAAFESRARLGWCFRSRGAACTPAACSADLGSTHAWTAPARRSDLGRAASTAAVDVTTRPFRGARGAATSAARGGQLGCHGSAAGAGLGCTSTRGAQGTGTSAARAGATVAGRIATGGLTVTSPDLGVAPRRGSASRRRGRSLVGLRPAGRSCFQTSLDRLGSGCGQLSAGDASCAVMERAGRGIVVGRAQERGARGSRRAVVGSAAELTRATGVVTASGG